MYRASSVDTIGRIRVDRLTGILLPAVMDQIFVDNRDFYTPSALDAAVNFNSFQ